MDPAQLLHDAAAEGRLSDVLALLGRGIAVDAPAPDLPAPAGVAHPHGETALHCAACWGHAGVLKLLLERGALESAANSDGMCALHFAASEGHLACVEALLSAKAPVNAADGTGKTPLIWAAENGRLEAVKRLLESGADAALGDKDGWTALHWAEMYGNEEVLEALLEHGAHDAPDKHGMTVLQQAKLEGDTRAQVELGRYNAVQSFRNKGDLARPPPTTAAAEAEGASHGCRCTLQ